ncbi:MAG: hypothetical protein GY750_09710, partial [Lentisphaerae bacterium]|nr:hypothetical protein [Lentisphaerota bacterium]
MQKKTVIHLQSGRLFCCEPTAIAVMCINFCPGRCPGLRGIEMLEQAVRDTRTQQKRQEHIIRSEDGLAVSEEEYWEKYYEHPYF